MGVATYPGDMVGVGMAVGPGVDCIMSPVDVSFATIVVWLSVVVADTLTSSGLTE